MYAFDAIPLLPPPVRTPMKKQHGRSFVAYVGFVDGKPDVQLAAGRRSENTAAVFVKPLRHAYADTRKVHVIVEAEGRRSSNPC